MITGNMTSPSLPTWSDVALYDTWGSKGETTLNRSTFLQLIENKIPYIRVAGVATPDECECLVGRAVTEGFGPYRGVEPIINRIGNTVFEYNAISKQDYFCRNPELKAVQEKIFGSSFNPLRRFMNRLAEGAGRQVSVARNDRGQDYYAGLIRRIENGTLIHVDYAPGEQPHWEVAGIQDQLAWSLYLRNSDVDSGKTHVFNRQWQPADDEYKEGTYGYNRRVVDGVEEAVFSPAVGEVVIFNSRNFHYVEPTEGERIAFTSAIGRTTDEDLILWS